MLAEAYNLSAQPLNFSSKDFCSESSNCNAIKLEGKDTLCADETSASYIAHRSPGCLQKISWKMDSSLIDHWEKINDSTIRIFFTPRHDHPEILKVYSYLQGCDDIKDSIPVVLLGPYQHSSGPETLCEGDSLKISPGAIFKTYLWQDGSGDSVLMVKTPGIYSVIATSFSGCMDKDSFNIVGVPAQAKVSIGPDGTLCAGESLTLHAGSDFQSYRWQDGSTDSVLKVYNEGLYSVTVSDKCDHFSTDTVLVSRRSPCNPDSTDSTSAPTAHQFIMPGAFTPNGDGHNDQICPIIEGPVDKYLFVIYNRWGQLVFKSATPGFGWNGRLRNVAQPPGGYVWYCKFTIGSQVMKKHGSLLLIE
jgi:gliding motility-associated-like protein